MLKDLHLCWNPEVVSANLVYMFVRYVCHPVRREEGYLHSNVYLQVVTVDVQQQEDGRDIHINY